MNRATNECHPSIEDEREEKIRSVMKEDSLSFERFDGYAVSHSNGIENRPSVYYNGQALPGVEKIEVKMDERGTEINIKIIVDRVTASTEFIRPLQN